MERSIESGSVSVLALSVFFGSTEKIFQRVNIPNFQVVKSIVRREHVIEWLIPPMQQSTENSQAINLIPINRNRFASSNFSIILGKERYRS